MLKSEHSSSAYWNAKVRFQAENNTWTFLEIKQPPPYQSAAMLRTYLHNLVMNTYPSVEISRAPFSNTFDEDPRDFICKSDDEIHSTHQNDLYTNKKVKSHGRHPQQMSPCCGSLMTIARQQMSDRRFFSAMFEALDRKNLNVAQFILLSKL